MPEHRVVFQPEGKDVKVEDGGSLLHAARRAGIYIDSQCGGEGACGRCKVEIIKGKAKQKDTSLAFLSKEEIEGRFVLACQTEIHSDLVVSVPSQASLEGEQILKPEPPLAYDPPQGLEVKPTDQERTSFDHPLTRKVFLDLPSPTLDDALADQERLFREMRRQGISGTLNLGIKSLRILPGLLRHNDWKLTATLWQSDGIAKIIQIEPGNRSRENYGIALDVGTTTMVAELVDLAHGKVIGVSASHNKQLQYGEDVINRIIFACAREGLHPLNRAVIENINQLIEQLVSEAGIVKTQITAVLAAGNPTMTHLLLNVEPCAIRQEPYIPSSNVFPPVRASDLGIDIHPEGVVMCMPGVSSYVGGDITSGVLASGMDSSPEVSALVDLGTNGEVVIGNDEWLVCCSASAGPAFEGGGLRCGMRATKGAIQGVKIEYGVPQLSVIGGEKPAGICGSGLIELIAELFRHKIVGPNGRFCKKSGSPRIRLRDGESEYVLALGPQSETGRDIFVTEAEIGNVIKSKAAVFSAAKVLIEGVGMSFRDLDRIFVAGGFGNHLNIQSAITIGLLPNLPPEKIHFIGNSSLSGAQMGLLSRDALQEAELIAKKMTYFELSVNQKFMDEFIAAMFIPHTNLDSVNPI